MSSLRSPPPRGCVAKELPGVILHCVHPDMCPVRPLLPSRPTAPDPAGPDVGHEIFGNRFQDGRKHSQNVFPEPHDVVVDVWTKSRFGIFSRPMIQKGAGCSAEVPCRRHPASSSRRSGQTNGVTFRCHEKALSTARCPPQPQVENETASFCLISGITSTVAFGLPRKLILY